jgi:glucose-6-phosphate dehydrogenase assembly protein OpcA
VKLPAERCLTSMLSTRMQPGTVDPSAIERELRRLNEGSTAAERSVRACMSNLIVYCDDDADADRIPPELGDLIEQHPARILLLVGHCRALDSGIAAHVAALCYQGTGGRQVCTDHVRLGAATSARRRLPAAVRPLLVGDLPTALWWATPQPPPDSELFKELAPMADQVIYDSVGWRDPARGVVAAAAWSAAMRQRVTDLAWSRLAPWRWLIAETFDPRRLQGGSETIRSVELEHGPHGLPQAWLLIGWLARCLGWQLRGGNLRRGIDVAWHFESQTGAVGVTVHRLPEGSPQIRTLSIRAGGEGSETVARFSAVDAERLSLRIEGAAASENVVALRTLSTASLLASQLCERSVDPLFRDALATSRDLADAVMH